MYRYLVVDDEILIRKGTLKKIQKLKLQIECVAEANNGKEAISFLENTPIDFVITDMDMPVIDGIELLDYLQINHPNLPVIVISGYQNFSYLQKSIQANAVNYILKPFSKNDILHSLTIVLKKLESEQRQNINEAEVILNNLLGNKTELGTLALKKRLLHAYQPHLVLIEYSLSELINQSSLFYSKIPNSSLVIAIFEMSEIKKKVLTVDILCAISQKIESLDKIEVYYHQCIDALNSRTLHSPLCTHIISNSSMSAKIEFPQLVEVLYYVESGNKELLLKNLPFYLRKTIETDQVSLLHLKNLGLHLLEKIKIFLDEFYNTNSNYTMPEVYKEVMERKFNFEDIILFFTEFLGNIAESLSFEHLYSSDDIIKNIQDYLDLHYSDHITLDFLADIFYINYSYLSTLFKERTGKKYIDYLNSLRIQKAKTLLTETERKSSSIAKKVGYNNEKYFYRVFKKYTGLTPEQYRNTSRN